MGKNNFTDQVGDWVKQRKEAPRDANTVAFLAVREDVNAALRAGYSVKVIWKVLRANNRVSFGYDTFRRHIRRFIGEVAQLEQLPVPEKSADASTATRAPSSQATTGTPRKFSADLPGFVFNPIPNKEELL